MPVYKKVNKDFFKKWSGDMAYVLGFFAADGYITVNKRGGQFWCIDIRDKELIEQIKTTIQSEHKISIRTRQQGKFTSYRLQIGNIEICNDLRSLGYGERKTNNLSIPSIPQKFFCHFVRGYFDGDGNVWSGHVHKERKIPLLVIRTVFTSCSKKFLNSLMSNLDSFGIEKGVMSKGKGNFYRLTYSTRNSLKMYKFMYNSLGQSKLVLQRKKKVFEKYLGTIDKTLRL